MVTGEVEGLEEGEGGDAVRDISRNALPIGDCDGGELCEVADRRGYGAGHVAGGGVAVEAAAVVGNG